MALPSAALYCQQEFEVGIESLVSWRGGGLRDCIAAAGVDPFDKSVRFTPHFAALEQIDWPLDACRNSPYVKYYDALAAAGHTRRNNGQVIASGLDRLAQFRELYRSIESSGHFESVQVTAESDGRFRFTDGQHRAAIALKLGYNSIPARIVGVDDRFQSLLSLLYADWPPHERTLYQGIEHPAFNDWNVVRTEERWRLLERVIDWRGKAVVDVGSHIGYFPRRLYRQGALVTAIEIDGSRLRISRELDHLFGTTIEYFQEDLRPAVHGKQFDVVLFLSVLHWILRDEGLPGVAQSLAMLGRAAPLMFFESASEQESKMRNPSWNHGIRINRETIPQLVLKYADYNRWRLLGADSLKRDLFMFWRE